MTDLKIKAIEYFAAKPYGDEKAKDYLSRVYEEIKETIVEANSYDSLSAAFDLLEKFISHVANDAIYSLDLCWQKLHKGGELESSNDYFGKYKTKENLYAKIISLLGRLRYIEQEQIVPILFRFWKEDESVQKDVEKVFKELAEYNLHAVEQIGFSPQLKLLDLISQLSDGERFEFFAIVVSVFEQFLSTDIGSHSWDYRTVTFKSMAIPASKAIRKLRSETVSLLMSMYKYSIRPKFKKNILITMNSACRVWSRAQVADEAKLIVEQNTIIVLEFWSSLVATESLELVQKIEHDAYWNYYHASSQLVKEAALKVEVAIKGNEEYQVYRDLVGFEGIFGSWEAERNLEVDYQNKQYLREKRTKEYIENVDHENLNEWLSRVESYLETDSRDLATFPELFKFVESISNRFPRELLTRLEETTALSKSSIAVIRGLWSSSIHDEFIKRVHQWIDESKFLRELSVAFISVDVVSLDLIEKFVDKVITIEDSLSLSSSLRILNERREHFSVEVINQLFEKMITFLNGKQDTFWINQVWFVRRGESFIEFLSEANVKLLVKNLVYANNVDHRVECILEHVSKKSMLDVFYFFEQRLEYKYKNKKEKDTYEDIPFSLHSISKVLAENPEELILLIKNNYEYKYGIASYGISSLFKKCFFPFEPRLIDMIIQFLNPLITEELKLILAIVKSYEGHLSVLPFVKRLLKEIEYDNERVQWIMNSLLNTGVVCGEYGMSDAYKSKLEDVKPWLNDGNVNVVKFSHQYSDLLKEMIREEVKRTDERIAIEKHRYG
jgi:hypothetical protein